MELHKENPKKSASFWSLLFMAWMNKLLCLGQKRTLTGKDLYALLEEDQTQNIVNEIENLWRAELSKSLRCGKNPRLWKALLDTFSLKLRSLIIFLRLLSTFSSLALALLVWDLLKILSEGSHVKQSSAILYMLGISIAGLTKTLSGQHYSYQSKLKGMRLKIAVIGLVYQKVITLIYDHVTIIDTQLLVNCLELLKEITTPNCCGKVHLLVKAKCDFNLMCSSPVNSVFCLFLKKYHVCRKCIGS